LAKFRNTVAEFRGFRVGQQLVDDLPTPELRTRVAELSSQLQTTPAGALDLAKQLTPGSPPVVQAVRERARELDRQAAQLRQTAQLLHERTVLGQLEALVNRPDAQIDLGRGALLIAQLDNEEVDVEAYLRELDRMANEVAAELPPDASGPARLSALNSYLFEQCGFHGARGDHYAHRSNSYLNEVLDDREGLPLTLSMVYIELARRLGVPVAGIPLPGHFVVRHESGGPPDELIDVYERGAALGAGEAEQLVRGRLGRPLQHSDLIPATRRAMLQRMLQNLLGLAERQRETANISRHLDALLVLDPDDAENRVRRAILRYSQGRLSEALADVNLLEARRPEGLNLEQLGQLKQAIERDSQ
jgi:regulator of sirC expression with transglutaminase-like and TPR domain